MEKKRRHHQVWQAYLDAWASGGQLFCLRAGRVFPVGTSKIAVERDFYRLKDVTPTDLEVIEKLCIERVTPELQRVHRGWIEFFTAVTRRREAYDRTGQDSPAVRRAFDEIYSNLEEDLHARIEDRALPHLAALRDGDLTFLVDDGEFGSFAYFLSVQYFRTAKRRSDMLAAMKRTAIPGFDGSRAWPLLSHIFATNVGRDLFINRKTLRATLLSPPAGSAFITSDQPVINTRGGMGREGIRGEDLKDDDLELYYPVSPGAALLLELDASQRELCRREISLGQLAEYNGAMFRLAHEQTFALNASALSELLTTAAD